MLKELYIENLAVIKRATVTFNNGLNVFTGETGAGKSILIGGINAVLGQRVSRDIVRSGCDKALVTALFSDLSPAVSARLEELGFDEEDELLLTREIYADGKSVARINMRTASASALRELGELLINIHGQHDSQVLLNPEKQLAVIEAFGGDYSLLERYQKLFHELQSVAKELVSIKAAEKERDRRLSALEAEVDELSQYELEKGEYATISEEYELIGGIGDTMSAVSSAFNALNGDDGENAVSLLLTAGSELEGINAKIDELDALVARIEAARIELDDIASSLAAMRDRFDIDPERAQYVTERFTLLTRLKKAYGIEPDELCERYEADLKELEGFDGAPERLRVLEEQRAELLSAVTSCAKELSAYRLALSEDFCQRVGAELSFLSMPGVTLVAQHEKGKLTHDGMDKLELLISANVGEPPKPIAKIASGGELSRFMLAMKCVIADKDAIPTMIFDEIDAGVSGIAAQRIGIKLRELASVRQVICVTHLSQIAVMADNHLIIEKHHIDTHTETKVITADENARCCELARIMGGDNPSELMLQNAAAELQRWKRNSD